MDDPQKPPEYLGFKDHPSGGEPHLMGCTCISGVKAPQCRRNSYNACFHLFPVEARSYWNPLPLDAPVKPGAA